MSDLFPIYFDAYASGAAGSINIWEHLTRKLKDNYEAMCVAKAVIEQNEKLQGRLYPRIDIEFALRKDGKLIKLFYCSRLPSSDEIAKLITVPGAQLRFDWATAMASPREHDGLEFQQVLPADADTISTLARHWYIWPTPDRISNLKKSVSLSHL